MPNETEEDMDAPVTRRELREEFASFEERFERKLDQKLEQKFEQKLGELKREIIAEFKNTIVAEISAELARHVNSISEQLRSDMRAVDDQYKSLPSRVVRLEERVFAPPPPAPKRAQRKRR